MTKYIKRLWVSFIFLVMCCGGAAQSKITRVEYYIDSDPGFGKATAIGITSDTVIKNGTININPTNLSTGVHFIGLRAITATGKWSLDNTWLFIKSVATPPEAKLSRVEYYIDKDPGYGKATTIGNPTDTVLNAIAIPVNPVTLSTGVHVIGLRALDANGKWSIDNTWLFIKSVATPPVAKLSRVEYYIDKDPGYGKATTIGNPTDTVLNAIAIPVNPVALTTGVHVIGLRALDANGKWGPDNTWLFIKPAVTTPQPNLIKVEYYIDADPGYGKGAPVAINPVTQIADLKMPVNVTGLSSGIHNLFIRSMDVNGKWNLDNNLQFNIPSVIPSPAIVVNSVPTKEMCAGSGFIISYQATGINDSNVFTVQLSNALGSFANPQAVGSFEGKTSGIINCTLPRLAPEGVGYRVRIVSSNPVLTGVIQLDSITIHNRPFVGNDTTLFIVCKGETLDLSTVYNTAGYSFQWQTSNISLAPEGVYGLMIVGTNGCRDTVYATVKQDVATWVGNASKNWSVAANWSTNRVPDEKTHVIIPAGTPYNCEINTTDAQAASVELKPGATWNITNSSKLMIAANCKSLPK